MLALRQFRKTPKGLPDLLNYAAVVDEGVVIGKDGAFMAGWTYRGDDYSATLPAQRNALAAHANAALGMLGSGWMTHHDCIRMPVAAYAEAKDSAFPEPISQLIDTERRNQFEQKEQYFESRHVLVVTYLPPTSGKSAVKKMMFEEDGKRGKASATSELEHFKSTIAEFEDRFSSIVKMHRLQSRRLQAENGAWFTRDEFLSYLHWTVTGIRQPINLPDVPMYLDALIGAQDFIGGVAPRIGRQHIRVVGIDGFPEESYPGILDVLDQVPIPYRWSTRFIYLDPFEADIELDKYRRIWEQKERSLRDQVFKTGAGRIDPHAMAMKQDTLQAKAEANSGAVRYGYYTSVILLQDEDEQVVDQAAKIISQHIRNMGFNARLEDINAVEAWLGSLPGHGVQNVRRPLMHTLNLAHLVPLSSVWAGEATNPCPFFPPNSPPLLYGATDGSTPWRFNIHVGDVGHTLILGPTGSGKSTKMVLMMLQFLRYPKAQVFAFDKGRSAFIACRAVGGRHYDVGNADGLAFAPLSKLKDERDLAWATDWVEQIAKLNNVQIEPAHRREIHRALTLLMESPHTTLTAFQATIQHPALKDALAPYVVDGAYGKYFDAEQDGMQESPFQVFEIEELMNLGERCVLPALDYLFYRIERQLHGQPTLLVLDEAWLMFDHPVFRAKIREWLKVLRKANASVVMGTQSLSDVAGSSILDVINESCQTKVFLANPLANEDEAHALYTRLGLNQTQINVVSQMLPKRDYYYTSIHGRRRYHLDLGPIALAFVGASGKEDIAAAKRLMNEDSTQPWQMRWLEHKGVQT